MNFNRLFAVSTLLIAAVAVLMANPAQAKPLPNPPPSGIVVHLFGPNSIMSNVVPNLPGEIVKPAPSPATSATTTPASPGQSGATVQPASQPATQTAAGANEPPATDAPEPSWGDVLHQMFIVGDPDAPIQPSSGRPGERPAAQ